MGGSFLNSVWDYNPVSPVWTEKTIDNFSHDSLCRSGDSKRNLPTPPHCSAEPVCSENHLCFLKQTFSCICEQEVKGHAFSIRTEGTGRSSKTLHSRCIPSQNHSLHTNVASHSDFLVVFSNMPFGLVHVDEKELKICWTVGRKREALDIGISTFPGTFNYFK